MLRFIAGAFEYDSCARRGQRNRIGFDPGEFWPNGILGILYWRSTKDYIHLSFAVYTLISEYLTFCFCFPLSVISLLIGLAVVLLFPAECKIQCLQDGSHFENNTPDRRDTARKHNHNTSMQQVTY